MATIGPDVGGSSLVSPIPEGVSYQLRVIRTLSKYAGYPIFKKLKFVYEKGKQVEVTEIPGEYWRPIPKERERVFPGDAFLTTTTFEPIKQ